MAEIITIDGRGGGEVGEPPRRGLPTLLAYPSHPQIVKEA